jgi:predicted MFS family arabinose efflux permease
MGLLTFSYILLWVEEPARIPTVFHIVALVVGVLLLDVGAQMTQVANQTRIFGLVPSARSRLNTVYMTVYFSGAAVGSALATMAWARWKWNGVCCLAIGFIALAGLRHATGRRSAGEDHPVASEEDLLLEA